MVGVPYVLPPRQNLNQTQSSAKQEKCRKDEEGRTGTFWVMLPLASKVWWAVWPTPAMEVGQ